MMWREKVNRKDIEAEDTMVFEDEWLEQILFW